MFSLHPFLFSKFIFMKKLLYTMILLPLSFSAIAQSAFVPMGGSASGSNGSLTYTVGQIAVQSASNGDKSVLEGVQQPYEIQTVGIDDYPGITLEAVVYPNPTRNYVQLRISNFDIPEQGLAAQLYDANGKLLEIYTVSDLLTQFDLSKYPAATYQLRVLDGKRMLKTFKVIRMN